MGSERAGVGLEEEVVAEDLREGEEEEAEFAASDDEEMTGMGFARTTGSMRVVHDRFLSTSEEDIRLKEGRLEVGTGGGAGGGVWDEGGEVLGGERSPLGIHSFLGLGEPGGFFVNLSGSDLLLAISIISNFLAMAFADFGLTSGGEVPGEVGGDMESGDDAGRLWEVWGVGAGGVLLGPGTGRVLVGMGGDLEAGGGVVLGVDTGGVLGVWGAGTGGSLEDWGVGGKLESLLNAGGFDFSFFIGLFVTSGFLGEPLESEVGVSLATAGTTILMSMR